MIEKSSFEQYNLTPPIKEALSLLGYHNPTEIQAEVIPLIMKGHDVVGKSQTGSGKTAAFAIPICEKINWEENAPGALVLEPTRELALQVKEEIFNIGRKKKIKVPVIFGGMPIDQQIISLKQKAHVVVGTPGRVLDHIRRGSINLSKIEYLVIDEADLMLDMGFLEDVETIINAIKPRPVTLLFSATMAGYIKNLVQNYMKNPVYVEVEKDTETVSEVVQQAYGVGGKDKTELLIDIMTIENPTTSMIFCSMRETVETLYKALRSRGIRSGMVHGGMEQRDRLVAVEEFRNGKYRHLVTTDVAARGIDFEQLSHVFNYDFPSSRESYVHRIGRTGRKGQEGKAISLFQVGEKKYLKGVEEFTGASIQLMPTLRKDDIADNVAAFMDLQKTPQTGKVKKGAQLQKAITKLSIAGGKKVKMRAGDVVGALCNIEGLTKDDIGIIDVRDTMVFVEIFHGKGNIAIEALKNNTIKGKIRKVRRL